MKEAEVKVRLSEELAKKNSREIRVRVKLSLRQIEKCKTDEKLREGVCNIAAEEVRKMLIAGPPENLIDD